MGNIRANAHRRVGLPIRVEPSVLGARIRELRIAAGYTQADLAAPVVAPALVSRIEAGARTPGWEVLQHFAEVLGADVEELLQEAAAPEPRLSEQAAFGLVLRQRRVLAGLSQAALADDIMTPAYVSRIEAGERMPSQEILEVLAAKLGVDVDVLLEEARVRAAESHNAPAVVDSRAARATKVAKAASAWLKTPVPAAYASFVAAVSQWEAEGA